jgi:acyl-CoA reductase-like NAD-dependent aldehyde dehydrogenase
MTENSLDAFLQKQHGLFINGEWVPGGEKFSTLNPATGGTLSVVTQAAEAK